MMSAVALHGVCIFASRCTVRVVIDTQSHTESHPSVLFLTRNAPGFHVWFWFELVSCQEGIPVPLTDSDS